MKRVEISYAGRIYSLADVDPAEVRALVEAAVAAGSGWLEVNEGEGVVRSTSLFITAGTPIAISNDLP